MNDERLHDEPLRIDKWLWAARFFKTRSLAAKAVDGGKVRLNGAPAKPARAIKPGDELAIRVGEPRARRFDPKCAVHFDGCVPGTGLHQQRIFPQAGR